MLTAADLAQIQAMIDAVPAVGEGFANPVVAGTQLVIPQINSPNYVLGVTGWAIRRDGTAQFTGIVLISGTFTGTNFIINSLGAFFYNGPPAAGNLIASIAPAAGADDGKGNAFQGGITSYSGTSFAQLFAAAVSFHAAGNVNDPQVNGTPGAQLAASSGTTAALPVAAILSLVPAAAGGISVVRLTNAALDLNEVAVPAAASGSGPQLFGNTSGHVGAVSDSAHGDSNTYDVERLSLFLAADTPIPSTSATTLMSKGIVAGTYRFDGIVKGVQGPTAIGQFVRFTGPGVTFNEIFIESNAVGNTSVTDSDLTGAYPLDHTTPAWGAGTTFYVRFKGIATFSAAGTFAVQGRANSGVNTWTAKAASLLDLFPVVAA
jgi:hypothetical protein